LLGPLFHPNVDFQRLARRLFKRSIALVLGGGGARGIAHLGFIKALEERGIPVDIVGGTSMGSCVGGLYARDLCFSSTYDHVKKLSQNARYYNIIGDLTYPYLSKTTGAVFQRNIQDLFGGIHLDDMWLEYYCAVTNITKNGISQMQYEGEAALSIAASMSYGGTVPPTCIGGDMLIDGCYSGNLPARRALDLGAEVVFIVDVSTLRPLRPQHYGSTLSGWKILYDRLNPFGNARKLIPPSSGDIIERLTQGTSLRELEMMKDLPGCFYLSLPVTHFSARHFPKFDEIFDAGYQYSKAWFREMEAAGKFPELATPKVTVNVEY
jgi:lysophospholipid hydrolase